MFEGDINAAAAKIEQAGNDLLDRVHDQVVPQVRAAGLDIVKEAFDRADIIVGKLLTPLTALTKWLSRVSISIGGDE